jgi:hypothetical protein
MLPVEIDTCGGVMKSAQSKSFILEEVAEHFAQWRSHKKQGERIPEPLWCGCLSDYFYRRFLKLFCGRSGQHSHIEPTGEIVMESGSNSTYISNCA